MPGTKVTLADESDEMAMAVRKLPGPKGDLEPLRERSAAVGDARVQQPQFSAAAL